MSFSLSVFVPGVPQIQNANKNWRSRWSHAKLWRQRIKLCCFSFRPEAPLPRAKLILTRYSSVEPDPDNLAASFKPVIDGLRDADVIENDRSANVQIEFKWRKAPPRLGKIKIEVEAML